MFDACTYQLACKPTYCLRYLLIKPNNSCRLFIETTCNQILAQIRHFSFVLKQTIQLYFRTKHLGRVNCFCFLSSTKLITVNTYLTYDLRDGIYRVRIVCIDLRSLFSQFYDFHFNLHNILTVCRCRWIWCLFWNGLKVFKDLHSIYFISLI